MPIEPREDEDRDEFISRCMSAEADAIPDQDQRLAACFNMWRRAKDEPEPNAARQLAVMRVRQGIELRRELLDGKEHVVLPLVALVEGVYQCANCPRPNFYPASEFGKVASAWNGRPVTIGHPVRDGRFVSAGSPDVWGVERVGTTFHAVMDGVTLKLEAWVDPEAVERAGDDAKAVMAAIEDGAPVEVSTAAFIDEVPHVGASNGRRYEAVQRNFQPDHMALLPLGEVGACSWEDGCGVRVNSAGGEIEAVEEARMATIQVGARTTDGTDTSGVIVVDGTSTAPNQQWIFPSSAKDPCGCVATIEELRAQLAKLRAAQGKPGDPGDSEEDGAVADEEKRAAAPPPEVTEGAEPKAQQQERPMERQLADALAEVDHLRAQLARHQEPKTEEEYINQAPPQMRQALVGLLKAQRRRELEQIEQIRAVTQEWSEDELKAMSADQLDRIAKLAAQRGGYDYSIAQAEQSRLAAASTDDEAFAALPPSPWDAPGGQA